jgi:hypothetical protein
VVDISPRKAVLMIFGVKVKDVVYALSWQACKTDVQITKPYIHDTELPLICSGFGTMSGLIVPIFDLERTFDIVF